MSDDEKIVIGKEWEKYNGIDIMTKFKNPIGYVIDDKLIKDMVSYEKDNKVADILKTMLMEMFGFKIQTEKGDNMFNLLNGYIASLFMDYISVHNGINIDDEKSTNDIKEIIKESSNKLLEGGFTGLTEDDINLIINRYRQYKKIVEDNENGIIITNKVLILL